MQHDELTEPRAITREGKRDTRPLVFILVLAGLLAYAFILAHFMNLS